MSEIWNIIRESWWLSKCLLQIWYSLVLSSLQSMGRGGGPWKNWAGTEKCSHGHPLLSDVLADFIGSK